MGKRKDKNAKATARRARSSASYRTDAGTEPYAKAAGANLQDDARTHRYDGSAQGFRSGAWKILAVVLVVLIVLGALFFAATYLGVGPLADLSLPEGSHTIYLSEYR